MPGMSWNQGERPSYPSPASWLGAIGEALREPGVVVAAGASSCRLPELVRHLHRRGRELEVTTDVHRLIEAPPGSLLLVQPETGDGPWLGDSLAVAAERGLRVVLWLTGEAELVYRGTAPGWEAAVSRWVRVPGGVPAFAVATLRAALRAPGLLWRDGPLEDCIREAAPRHPALWFSILRPCGELLEAVRAAKGRWLCFTDVNSSFQARRLRWVLAEAGRYGRVAAMGSWTEIPGWWPAEARPAELDQAVRLLARGGFHSPGRVAALAGLEPSLLRLLLEMAQRGLPEERLEASLGGADPAWGVARLAMEQGLVDLDRFLLGREEPALYRVLAELPELRHRRQQVSRRTWLALRRGRPVEPDVLRMLAAHSRSQLSAQLLLRQPIQHLDALVEVALRRGIESTEAGVVLARSAVRLGDLRFAERLALDLLRGEPGEAESWPLRCTLAWVRYRLGDVSGARRWLEQVPVGRLPPARALEARLLLALCEREEGEEGTAVERMRGALVEARQLGEPLLVARFSQCLGTLLLERGELDEAEPYVREALQAYQREPNRLAAALAGAWRLLGRLHLARGELEAAGLTLRRDLELVREALGEDHPSVAESYAAFGDLLMEQGELAEALVLYERALSTLERCLGPNAARLADFHLGAGRALLALGRKLEALGHFNVAERLFRERGRLGRRGLRAALEGKLRALEAAGDRPAAEAARRRLAELEREE